MMGMIVPGQAVFLFCIYMMQAGHQSMTLLFIFLYMICSMLQGQGAHQFFSQKGLWNGQKFVNGSKM